ncbi:hypothetical protein BDV23DRAFT_68145 [Aspergillus alliaceus]|uniref:Zn(2)-C6 fungal-type domain-containing protein n=1 Tax=Petromyces alliaceus TaxID=209559 RepID=A0A5N7CD46_PETAA|nr:hypothetical protein BDV23DRAFT_68145 [Aspergillus alliaceus]
MAQRKPGKANSEQDIYLKNSKVSTACTNCQTHRIRCNVDKPCQQCVKHSHECVWDESSDGRRKAALKSAQHDLDHNRTILNQLFNAIHECECESLQDIIQVIKQGATPEEVIKMATEYLKQIPVHPYPKKEASENTEEQ